MMNANAPVPSDNFEYQRTVDISEYFRTVWRWRWIPIVLVLLAGATAWMTARSRPKVYEASVTLRVASVGTDSTLPRTGESVVLLRNRAIAADVVRQTGLDKPPHNMTPEMFADSLIVQEVVSTPLLIARVRSFDASVSQRAANLLASRAVGFLRQLNDEKIWPFRDLLEKERQDAQRHFDEAGTRYIAFQRSSQPDLMRRDVAALLDKRGDLLSLNVEISGERAKLVTAEQELARQPEVLAAPRRPGDSSPLARAMADAAGAESRSRPVVTPRATQGSWKADASRTATTSVKGAVEEGSGVAPPPEPGSGANGPATDEYKADILSSASFDSGGPFANPVHVALSYQVAATRIRISALERQQAELMGRHGLRSDNVRQIGDLQQKETQLAALQVEYELARDLYTSLAKRHDEARANLSPQFGLQITDPATLPAEPISANPLRAAAVAMTSALILSIVAIFVLNAFVMVRRKPAV